MTLRNTATDASKHLERGTIYRATTRSGVAVGEYLGLEAPHGDLSILLRHAAGTHSIELGAVLSIEPLAA